MGFAKKVVNAVRGLLLYARFVTKFDSGILKNKRVALVGPASSAYNSSLGKFIDGFDYVIRINKAPSLIKEGRFINDIGAKTDILFHSFVENDFSGGGALNFDLFKELGIKYVINPIPTFFGKRLTFNFYKKYLLKQPVYSLSRKPYLHAVRAFGKFLPTTGFCALKMAMESDFSELYVTGFTFFKTAYGDGYRDALKDVEKNRKYIAEAKMHDPDIEFEQFLKMLRLKDKKKILLDSTLEKIVQEHYSQKQTGARATIG